MTIKDEISSLNKEEKSSFDEDYSESTKSLRVYFLFCLFLGFLGGHQYYLGRIVPGILYTLFSWTLIPFIVSLVQLFFAKKTVAEYNEELSEEILLKIKANHVEGDISLPEISVNVS